MDVHFQRSFFRKLKIPSGKMLWYPGIHTLKISKLTPNLLLNSESLWYNPKFKIGRHTIFYKSWYQKGVQIVDDLINTQGNFMTAYEFETNYGIKDFFKVTGLEVGNINVSKKFKPKTCRKTLFASTFYIHCCSKID